MRDPNDFPRMPAGKLAEELEQIRRCHEQARKGNMEPEELAGLLEASARRLRGLEDSEDLAACCTLQYAFHELFKAAKEAEKYRGRAAPPAELGTELAEDLDLLPGRLMVLVGAPGSGKTALAVQWALAAAERGTPVLYASAELDAAELAARVLALRSGEARIAWRDFLQGTRQDDAADLAAEVPADLAGRLHLWAPTGEARSADMLRAMAGAVSKLHDGKPPLIVLDYVQRWAPVDAQDRRVAVQNMSGDLRALSRPAGEWPGAGILALSSASREKYAWTPGRTKQEGKGPPLNWTRWSGWWSEDRAKPPPAADGLIGMGKETGELEYDAAIVAVLVVSPPIMDTPVRSAALAVAKNRYAAPCAVRLDFDAAQGVFGGPGTLDTFEKVSL